MQEIQKLTDERGAEKIFETAGSPITIAQTPYLVKRGGTIILVGMSSNPKLTYNFGQIMSKEATIKSIFRYRNVYPRAIEALAD